MESSQAVPTPGAVGTELVTPSPLPEEEEEAERSTEQSRVVSTTY